MKFKDRKIGKILTSPAVKGLIKSIPIVGDAAKNVLDEVEGSEAGQINKKELTTDIIKVVATLVLLYLAMSGKISFEEAEQGKEFIGR